MTRRGVLSLIGATGSVAFLVAMVVAGALPGQRQLVKFEARGVMKLDPDLVTRVELQQGDRKAALTRAPGGSWLAAAGPLPADVAGSVSLAVQFMNTAAPIRLIAAEEIPGVKLADFGLEPARLHVVLYQGSKDVLGARFGSHNPEDTAQYMMLDDSRDLVLMSRFVGQQWENIAAALPRR